MALTPNLGSQQCLARQWLWYQWLYQESLGHLPLNALSGGHYSHTHTYLHTHLHTCSLIHALTLNWIFKLIILCFSYKISLRLGASGQNSQLLYSHLGAPFPLGFCVVLDKILCCFSQI